MPTVGPVRLDQGKRGHLNLNYSVLIDVVHRRERPEIKAVVGELLPDLGLKPSSGNKEALSVLVGNLFTAWLTTGNPFVAVPLRASQYAPGTRMRALFLKYKPTADAVHALGDAGHIELHRGFYSEADSRCTRIRATEKLVSLFLRHRLCLDGFELRDNTEVVLRNAAGRGVDISRGSYASLAKPFRENVRRINTALTAAKVELHVDEQLFIDKFLKRPDGRKAVNPPHPLHNQLTRIFNVNFDLGGRFYRHWSQGLPRELRRFIRINAEPVQEVDYKAIHPSLLYAERGQRIPAGEMYLPQGWPKGLRPAFKILMLAAVNAADLDAAVKGARDGIRHMPELRNIDEDILRDGWLLGAFEALLRLHAPIADAFFTGAGLRLQRLDSEIAELVMLDLLDNGVVALPIHDSFVVGLHAVELLRAAMSAASMEVCGQSIAMDEKWPIDRQLSLTNHDVVRKAIPVMDGGSSLSLGTLHSLTLPTESPYATHQPRGSHANHRR